MWRRSIVCSSKPPSTVCNSEFPSTVYTSASTFCNSMLPPTMWNKRKTTRTVAILFEMQTHSANMSYICAICWLALDTPGWLIWVKVDRDGKITETNGKWRHEDIGDNFLRWPNSANWMYDARNKEKWAYVCFACGSSAWWCERFLD